MNKLSLLLLIQIICFALTLEYETRCPAAGEWRYRGRKLNCGSTQYVCLFHTSLKIYHENCEGLDYSSTGSKLIFEPVFNKALCSYNRYQPFRFSTDGSSKCAYHKSYCNEKGQYVFHKGSLERDTACGCDLSSGYEFVSSPKNNCYCIPSEEDCTCHKLPCNAKDEQCPLDDDVIKIRRSAENGLFIIWKEDNPNNAKFMFTEGNTGIKLRLQCLYVTAALSVAMILVVSITHDIRVSFFDKEKTNNDTLIVAPQHVEVTIDKLDKNKNKEGNNEQERNSDNSATDQSDRPDESD